MAARGRRLALALCWILFSSALPATAQDAAEDDTPKQEEKQEEAIPTTPPEGVEVIRIKGKTVTAMETEVPTSVTQFDPATIAALGAQNVTDLAKVTPNVEIRSQGATTATFFIRGVGLSDFGANAAGAVSIYQDDVSLNSPALQVGKLFDLANVDVLRGPQGSGAGRNASAGAIKIYSRKPTNSFEALFRTDLGNSSEDVRPGAGFASRDFEGALQVPLVDEVLSSRFAFRLTEKDPFRKNGCSTRYVPTQEERNASYEDWLGVDVCGITRDREGPFPNPNPPPANVRITDVDPVEGRHKVNDTDNWAARGALRFTPADIPELDLRMDFILNFHGSRLDEQSTLGQAIGTVGGFGGYSSGSAYQDPDITAFEDEVSAANPGLTIVEVREITGPILAKNLDSRPYRGDYDRVGQTTLDTWGTFVRGDFEFGNNLSLALISSYDEYDRHRDTDQDFTPLVLFEAIADDDGWQFTHDLRLTGELEEHDLRWNVGGFYLQERIHSDTTQDILAGGGITTADTVYTQKTWSFGIFAGFEMDFLEDFTLELGGRYNWERKEFDFSLVRPTNAGELRREQLDERTWDAPTGTLALTYRLTPDISIYSKVSRGWKGGHFNSSANLLQAAVPAEPETITATETGLRARFLDNRVDLRTAFFYYRYEDYQVFLFENSNGAPPLLQIINANDAENLGAEWELTIKPIEDLVPDLIDGLRITLNASWLRSEFLDFTQTQTQTNLGVVTQITNDFSGNPLINSPEWKVVLNTEWPLDLGRWGRIIPRYDGVWTDDIFFDPTGGRGIQNQFTGERLPEYAIGQKAYWMHNLRLAYQLPNAEMEIAAWVRNLEDKVVKTYAFDASAFSGIIVNFVGEPRTWGLSLSFKY